MPARLSSMELSDPLTPDPSGATNRRKSTRTRQKPVLLQEDFSTTRSNSGSNKRKRTEPRSEESADNEEDNISDDESSPEESDGDPDQEELKERKRRAPKPKKTQIKPSAKKPKVDNTTTTTKLAVRPAMNGTKKASKPKKPPARSIADASEDVTGLYGIIVRYGVHRSRLILSLAEVFSQGHTLDAVAADWMTRYEQHQANAVCDLINFVLKCTGCDLQVDLHDIEDPDNASSKLTDLQDEYNRLKITDYPLISKTKGNASFRSTMTGFLHALISTAHAAGVLYSDEALIENIQVWVTSMSSSIIRPFRHTATVIALSICSTMCTLAAEIADNIAKTMRQKDSEQKRKNINKARVADLQAKVVEEERKRAAAERIVSDIYDTVYVNRYRDVDPKIRVECVTALGTWITTLPDIFFAGQYLRYLGWVLSDTSAPTRAEVIKQLSRFFKNKENIGRLRAFTERFRPRLVEMATRDTDPGIRAATVDLLDMVRETGLLEPDDIDVIGRLIFDAEPRVRKAVAGFFAENINDLFESTVEDLGGEESIDEFLAKDVEDDYDAPRIAWLKFKCLAEVLQSYNDGDGDESPLPEFTESLSLGATDSRFSLAAKAIYEGVTEVRDWEVLAGYLLFDHSSPAADRSDQERAFYEQCMPKEKQELLLLQVLSVAVKSRLVQAIESETDKKGKRTKARTEESRGIQEATAIHLAQVIPQLLKKFGSSPAPAAAVLRLEHILNLEIFQELRQDSTAYSSLLDDINKQFLTHADQIVLQEASAALLHARSFEDLEETTESKMQDLWEDTINSLRSLTSHAHEDGYLLNICNTVRRVSNLASISDCVVPFSSDSRSAGTEADSSLILNPYDILLDVIREHKGPSNSDDNEAEETNELVINAMKALLFYHMWHARSIRATINNSEPLPVIIEYDEFAQVLLAVTETRSGTDPVRLAAAGIYLDLYTLFATFRHSNPNEIPASIQALIQHIPSKAHPIITSIYGSVEKQHAKKSHHKLESAPDDRPDVDTDPEDSDDSDEEDPSNEYAQASKLLAEKQLCEMTGKIVMAIIAQVLDCEGEIKDHIRRRLLINRTKLGGNFRDVVAYLDEPKAKAKPRIRRPIGKKEKSDERVEEEEEEVEEEDVEREIEEGGEEDLRRRELDDVDDAASERREAPDDEEVVEGREDDEIMGD